MTLRRGGETRKRAVPKMQPWGILASKHSSKDGGVGAVRQTLVAEVRRMSRAKRKKDIKPDLRPTHARPRAGRVGACSWGERVSKVNKPIQVTEWTASGESLNEGKPPVAAQMKLLWKSYSHAQDKIQVSGRRNGPLEWDRVTGGRPSKELPARGEKCPT